MNATWGKKLTCPVLAIWGEYGKIAHPVRRARHLEGESRQRTRPPGAVRPFHSEEAPDELLGDLLPFLRKGNK